jgi:tetratricopeptide (TPR) repeat protein
MDTQVAVTLAMQATADRLWDEWADKKPLWNAIFNHLPQKKSLLKELKEAIHAYYQCPTDKGFSKILTTILEEHQEFTEDAIRSAVERYTAVLTEQLLIIDKDFRENIRGLADFHVMERLNHIEELLANRTQLTTETTHKESALSQEKLIRVRVIVEGMPNDFTPSRVQDTVNVLAATLSVNPNYIQILQVLTGSIILIIEMPTTAVNRLYKLATQQDFRLINFGFQSITVEGKEPIELSKDIASDVTSFLEYEKKHLPAKELLSMLMEAEELLEIQRRQDAKSHYLLGMNYEKQKEHYPAIDEYTHAVDLDPQNIQFYYMRASLYFLLENYPAAVVDYSQIIEIDPTAKVAYIRRGLTYDKMENYIDALADYSHAIEMDPESAQLYIYRGSLFHRLHDYTAALDDYNMAISIDPKSARVHFNLGMLMEEMDNTSAAEKNYRHAIELDGNFAEAYMNLSLLLVELGRKSEAEAEYQDAVKINPNIAKVYSRRRVQLDEFSYQEKGEAL